MILGFGDYEIDVERREIRRAKALVHVEPQVFDLLVDQHNTGNPVYERIERVIVERPPQSAPTTIPDESGYDEPSTDVTPEMPRRDW